MIGDSFAKWLVNRFGLDMRPIAPFEPRWIHEKVLLIDIPARSTVAGSANGSKNILTHVFWTMLFGLLIDSNLGTVKDINGSEYDLRTLAEVAGGTAYIYVGSGTQPESISVYTLARGVKSLSTSISVGMSSDRSRITLSAVTDVDASEIGIMQTLFNSGGGWCCFLLAYKAMNVSANQAIAWHIDFMKPWLYNMALWIYGVLNDSDVEMTEVGGSKITVPAGGDANGGPCYIVVTDQSVTWSPDLYSLPNAISLKTYRAAAGYISVVYLMLVGVITPSTDYSCTAIGIVQPMFDTTKNRYNFLLFAHVLDQPVTLKGSRTNCIVLRFVAV